MDNEPMTCAYVYSAREYERGQKAAGGALPKTRNWKIVAFAILIGIVMISLFIQPPPPKATTSGGPWTTALINFGPVLLIGLLVIWLVTRQRKKAVVKFDYLDQQVTHILSDSGVRFESPLTEVSFKWPAFDCVLETDEGFVLISGGERLFTWLPKRGFASSESIARVRELMRHHVSNSSRLFPAGS